MLITIIGRCASTFGRVLVVRGKGIALLFILVAI